MFVTLTRFVDKAPFYLGQGICIEPTHAREAARGALSKITLHGTIHYVTETPEEIVAKFEAMEAAAARLAVPRDDTVLAKTKRFPVPVATDADNRGG